MENSIVKNNREAERFELELDGSTAFIDYSEQNNVVAMTHTEVPSEFEGKGIGSRLVKGALDLVKEEGKRVRPLCSFVAAYIKRHPEYESLVV